MTITLKITDSKFFVRADNAEGHSPDPRSYFNYVATVQAIVDYLKERFGTEFRLYEQDDGNEIWNGLEEDVHNEYEGVEHAASLYDLVETRAFAYTADLGQNRESYTVRPAVRNNLFIYSKHRVAMARVPKVAQHGLSYEDLIFSESDDGLVRFLGDMRSRQLADRKIIVFTDTRDGLEQARELTSSPVARDEVFMDKELKTQIYRSIDEFFSKDRSFFQTYGIP